MIMSITNEVYFPVYSVACLLSNFASLLSNTNGGARSGNVEIIGEKTAGEGS